jgi:hypothetical protein
MTCICAPPTLALLSHRAWLAAPCRTAGLCLLRGRRSIVREEKKMIRKKEEKKNEK